MNLFTRFKKLIPTYPLRVGTVLSVDGTSVQLEEVGGARLMVRGADVSVGDKVYFRDGVIEGPAPSLPLEVIEV